MSWNNWQSTNTVLSKSKLPIVGFNIRLVHHHIEARVFSFWIKEVHFELSFSIGGDELFEKLISRTKVEDTYLCLLLCEEGGPVCKRDLNQFISVLRDDILCVLYSNELAQLIERVLFHLALPWVSLDALAKDRCRRIFREGLRELYKSLRGKTRDHQGEIKCS